jgi:hypothetical protein
MNRPPAAKRPETSQGLSAKIAKNLKEKYELLNQYVVNYVEGAKLPKDIFSDAMRHFNMFAEDMRVLDYRINTLKDVSDKRIFEELFDKGGMATGTSSELPAVMLDKLGEFLAEDPYGNMEKVDKFCTYLENNGPAALHVADGKNVDLNWIYREVIG